MPKPSRAAQQPAAKQPNSLPFRVSGSAQPSKASRYKLPFAPYKDKTFSEVPVRYLWYLAGFDKYTAKGNLFRASVLVVEYLKEVGLIQPKNKRKKEKIKFCACCQKNRCKLSKKFCGKCEREREANRERDDNARRAAEVLAEQIVRLDAPEWHSREWLVP